MISKEQEDNKVNETWEKEEFLLFQMIYIIFNRKNVMLKKKMKILKLMKIQ